MSQTAKTIQIYLPKGNPSGLRVAEMTTRTVRLIEIPRVDIHDFFARDDANQVGLYFLLSDSDDSSKPKLYIGQTGELKRRLSQHHLDTKKEFWTRAFVMLSTNNTMTQTHALYLEHKAIKTAQEVGRYDLQNGNHGNRPHTPDPLKADCEALFNDLDILLFTLGQPIFELHKNNLPIIPKQKINPLNEIHNLADSTNQITNINSDKASILFYCKTKSVDAKGYYNKKDGFVILKGSLIRKLTSPSLSNWAKRQREQALSENKLVDYSSESYKLTEDLLCKTPSGACDFVMGSSNNGWNVWKNSEGQTLKSSN